MEQLVQDLLTRKQNPEDLTPEVRTAITNYLKEQSEASRLRAEAAKIQVDKGERELKLMKRLATVAAGVFIHGTVLIMAALGTMIFSGAGLASMALGAVGIAHYFATVALLHFAVPASQRNRKR